MGPTTVIYGTFMLLTGAAAWLELDAFAWPVAIPLIVGAIATPLGLLVSDLRARRTALIAVTLLAVFALIAAIPGTSATLALLAGADVAAPDAAATQVVTLTFSAIYVVIAIAAWWSSRRQRHPRDRTEQPRSSAGYAVMGR